MWFHNAPWLKNPASTHAIFVQAASTYIWNLVFSHFPLTKAHRLYRITGIHYLTYRPKWLEHEIFCLLSSSSRLTQLPSPTSSLFSPPFFPTSLTFPSLAFPLSLLLLPLTFAFSHLSPHTEEHQFLSSVERWPSRHQAVVSTIYTNIYLAKCLCSTQKWSLT